MFHFIKTYRFGVLLSILLIHQLTAAANESSEQLHVGKSIHHFYDATKQAFVVISNDSTYQLYNEEKHVYETRKLTFATDSTFQHFIHEFIPISTSDKGTFFVHGACGPVYHFIGDSIYRHDQSFYHKNQYGGVLFEYMDEIYMYGGYGMFTEKNILIYYNHLMREWIQIEYANLPPMALKYTFVIQNGERMFTLGGVNRLNVFSDGYVRCFNLTTKSWETLGEISSAFKEQIKHYLELSYPRIHGELLVFNTCILLSDITNNKFVIRSIRPTGSILSIKTHPKNNTLVQVHLERTGRKNYFVQVMSLNELLGETLSTGNIWEEPTKKWLAIKYWQQLSAFLIGLLLMWIVLFVNNRKKAKRSNTIRIDFRKIDLQDPQFIAMQKLFLTAPDHTVEVSAINPIVEEEGITPDTIKKRRERLIKEFSTAVAIQTGLAPTEIFLEMRHPKDKRIKLLKLSNKLIASE